MRKILSICLLLIAVVAQAQIQEPVKFKSELKTLAAGEAEIVFTATIDKGWHVYSTDLGDGGPISATFNVEKISGATVVGKLQPKGKEIASYDKLFEMNVRYFESTAQFVQKLKLTGGDYKIEGFLEFGACNDENCLPPTQVEFNFSGKAEAAKGAAAATPAEKVTARAEDTKPETQPASQTVTPADTASTGIIGGADGPTSIFIAGHLKKQPLKIRIKNSIYRYKRKKVEKTIVANPHSLSETVQYAKDKYELTETAPADREYIEQIKCLKESLILQYEPELLGEMKDIPVPDFSNEASVKEYLGKIKTRSEMIAEMPDSIIPMDFHLYKIRIDDDFLEMEIDYTWNIFGMSYSGNKAVMKKFKKISRDLYSYYGVTEKDIKNKTKRYSSLVTNLSS